MAPIGIGKKTVIIVSNPKGIQDIFATESKHLDAGEVAGVKLPFVSEQSLMSLSDDKIPLINDLIKICTLPF